MTCPTDHALLQFLDAQAGAQGPAIEAHLERCELCRRALDPAVIPPLPSPVDVLPILEQLKRTPPASAVSPSETVRPSIAGYTLARLIGRSGMGLVYEGVQQSLGQRVAVKVLADGPFARAELRE